MTDEPRWWSGEELDRERWGSVVEDLLGRAARALARRRFPQAVLLVGLLVASLVR